MCLGMCTIEFLSISILNSQVTNALHLFCAHTDRLAAEIQTFQQHGSLSRAIRGYDGISMREPELRIGYQLIINDPREGGQLTIK